MQTDADILKTVDQDSSVLLDNLTGGQIQEVLDTLILAAISPIILHSKLFDTQVVYLLGLVTKNRKRKLSALPREEFISILCQYLSTKDPQKKLALIETAKIERGFLYNFVVNVLKKVDQVVVLYQKRLTCTDKAESIRLSKKIAITTKSLGISADNIYCIHLQSSDYLALAYEFRNSIVNNYVRYAYKQAKAFCSSKTNTFDFQDVWHNFLTAITKAIDKYDCSKGALTSYIKWWILNVQTSSSSEHSHEYGTAYSIPQLHRKKLATSDATNINFSISLNAIANSENSDAVLKDYVTSEHGLDEHLEVQQEAQTINYLIKKSDLKGGLARLYLDLGEYFSKKELRKMAQVTMSQVHIKPNVKL